MTAWVPQPCFSLFQNPNDLSLSKQTIPQVVLLAPLAFGRTLFLLGVDLGEQVIGLGQNIAAAKLNRIDPPRLRLTTDG